MGAGPSDSPAFTVYLTEYYTGTPVGLRGAPLDHQAGLRYVRARRSDGSTADQMFAGPPAPSTAAPLDNIDVIDMRTRRWLKASRALNAISTYPMPAGDPSSAFGGPTPESGCLLTRGGSPAHDKPMEFAGREKVLGIDTLAYLRPDGSKVWLAPSLACQTIKGYFSGYDKDRRLVSLTEQEPDKIMIGPPDESLFQPVGDEVTPSEMHRRRLRHVGLDVEEGMRRVAATLARQDKTYREAQARK